MSLLDEFAQACAEVNADELQKYYASFLIYCWKHHSRWRMESVNKSFIASHDVTIEQIRSFPHGGCKFEDYFTVSRFIAYNFPETSIALCKGFSHNLCKSILMQERKTNGIQIASRQGFGAKVAFL